ncbi:MAG: 2-amino-4-hydroxy-6-hydroxymethyldihydropteridine diphosphokinase [Candidatus Krumholzibacteriota bacterium]|nr:2-amino-4-hydroxy-6-hydroxymethyldihydropteridine diphosphokinase [Candidatus Krumholzibacteriota bacterium]
MANSREKQVYLGLGSNVGEREGFVLGALRHLEATGAASLVAFSDLYETQAVGMGKAMPFVNAVAEVATLLSPMDLLLRVKVIEREIGRSGGHNLPREIDIDIVAWGDSVFEMPGLIVPHPRYADRAFVLVPLRDVAPTFVCPVTGATIAAMIARVGTGGITRISQRHAIGSTTS